MSFQITVMKVLAGHPEGRASIADLTRCVAVLTTSGADWSQRMKRLAARAPGLDIFTSGYVQRDENGWLITGMGRQFLASIEAQAIEPAFEPATCQPPTTEAPTIAAENVIQLVAHKVARSRRAAA